MEKKDAQQIEQKQPELDRPEEEQVKELSGEDVEQVAAGMREIPRNQWEYQAPPGIFL